VTLKILKGAMIGDARYLCGKYFACKLSQRIEIHVSSSFYLFIKQFHKNMTADNTRTEPTRLAKHSQWPQ